MWFGTHTLAENCTVTVTGKKDGANSSWIAHNSEEMTLPAGTVISMQSGTSEAIFALLNGGGIAISKETLANLVVQD